MAADYEVFSLMLVVSSIIGVYFTWVRRGQENAKDFLTLKALPVSISLTATVMSSITVLSSPAEVYCCGDIFVYFRTGYIISTPVVTDVFLPVFYRLAITSTYEVTRGAGELILKGTDRRKLAKPILI